MRKPTHWPPVRFVLDVIQRYNDDGGGQLAASVTYYAFLSVLPLVLLAMSAAGFLISRYGEEEQTRLVVRLSGDIPGLGPLIERNLDALIRGRTTIGVIAVVGIIWAGSGGMGAGRFALAKIFRVKDPGGIVAPRLRSLGLLLIIGVLALAAVASAGLATNLRLEGTTRTVILIAGMAGGFVLDFAAALVAYYFLTPKHPVPVRDLLPGTILAASMFLALKIAGSWYAARVVAGATAIYGTFAGVIGALVLLNLAAQAFLYGAELSALLRDRRKS
ncbi:MAG: YihY/virulence factor BrkB family protein [Actinomycetota bacterium]